MLNVNQATKTAWLNNEIKTYRVLLDDVQIPDHKIYAESMKIQESVNDYDSLHFIGCVPSRMEMTLREVGTEIEGQKIQVFVKAGNTTEICLFTGYITSANNDAAKTEIKIIAYDKLYEFNKMDLSDWYRSLTFPMTMKQFRDGLFSYLDFEQEEVTLCNDEMIIEETIGGSIKGEVLLTNICDINGVMGMMSRDGELFRYITLPQFSLDTVEPYRVRELDYEDFTCKPINKVWIREDSDDIGVTAGTGTNVYIVQGNVFAFGKSSEDLRTIAANLLNQMGGISYVPSKATIQGYPIYEAGDAITYERPDGGYTMTYVLARTMKGLNNLVDEIKGMGCENYGNALTTTYDELIQLRGQSTRLKKSVEGITTEVTTIRDNYASKSQLQQTSDSLTAQIEYLQQEIDGQTTIYYGHGEPTLLNYPAWDFTYNIPCNNTVQLRDDLMFEYTEEYYRKNLRSLYFDEDTNIAYRFSMVDGEFGWIEVADGEMGAILQRLSSLELTTEAITTEVAQIETTYATKTELNSTVEQTAQNITSTVSANYQTKTEAETTRTGLQSQITQNATNINSKVSKGNVVSEINQSADQITLSANRLVVDSEKFKLSADGAMECSEAAITGGYFDIKGTNEYINTRVNSSGLFVYRDKDVQYAGSIFRTAQTMITPGSVHITDTANNASVMIDCYTFSTAGAVVPLHSATFRNVNFEIINGRFDCSGNALFSGSLRVLGSKNRVVQTKHYGMRCQNAYETCEPYFGDIGEAKTNEEGVCIVPIEKIFGETVTLEAGYQVFIQEYGEGKLYVAERNNDCFVIKGTPDLEFGWEIKARQKGYENVRLEKMKEIENGD